MTNFYQNILSLDFAVKEINQNPKILQNVTLGFLVHDSYNNAWLTYCSTMNLLFKSHRFVFNYNCETHKKLIAVIGARAFDTSLLMAQILNLYKIPQLTYGSFVSSKEMMEPLPFYQMGPAEDLQYQGIISLLKHFGWAWVGLFVAEDYQGELFLQALETLFSSDGICAEFTRWIPSQDHFYSAKQFNDVALNMLQLFKFQKSRISVIYGETFTFLFLLYLIHGKGELEYEQVVVVGMVWIMTAQIDFILISMLSNYDLRPFQGAIAFSIHSNALHGFQEALQMLKPDWRQADGFLEEFWEEAFDCIIPDPHVPYKIIGRCTGEESLESIPGRFFEMHMTGHSYNIYNAVYAVAHALNALYSWQSRHRLRTHGKATELQDLQPWQLHPFLQGMSFNNSAGESITFNDHGETEGGFDVTNFITFPNKSFCKVKVGLLNPKAAEGEKLIIEEDKIVWHQNLNQVVPHSVCTDPCLPGHQKKKREGKTFCCYDCDPCPEGKISNQSDTEDCFQCPEDQYPNEEHDQCIPKLITFLSYEEPLGRSLTCIAVSFALVTLFVLHTFIKHHHTPIVKANNQGLTYMLLISLLLCFLSIFLFLGKPEKVACLLQQPIFGLIFTVAVSCVLAKTITVVVAFMATKPDSSMRKWIGKRLAVSIILSCFFVQAGICVLWLNISPPFPELEMHSVPGEITAQCHSGSITMFYLVLNYMWLLSIICFSVAFLARKLPDSFNEARFITFSMLIFNIVWLSFVPTYLSTKGKFMVAVEIFSILASSAGLLGCIFSPKCYLILFKPEINNRAQLIKRKK